MTRISQRRLPNLGVAGLAGLLAVAVAGPADARGKREEAAAELAAARPAGLPLMAVVSLGDQRITIYDARGQDPAGARLHRPDRLRDAGRHLQRHPEEPGALLQPLRRCLHAVHAAHHLVGHRAARRRAARLSRLAWLHPHAARLRRAPVRHDQDGSCAWWWCATTCAPSSSPIRPSSSPARSAQQVAAAAPAVDTSADDLQTRRMRLGAPPPAATVAPRPGGGRRRQRRAEAERLRPRRPRRRAGPPSRPSAEFGAHHEVGAHRRGTPCAAQRCSSAQVEREIEETRPEIEEKKAASSRALTEARRSSSLQCGGAGEASCGDAAREAARAAEAARSDAATAAKIAEDKMAPVSVLISRQDAAPLCPAGLPVRSSTPP